MSEPSLLAGHAFISYVREDSSRVDQLQRTLEAAGIPVWRDIASLWPGEDWRVNIRRAIVDDALAFIVCFSHRSLGRDKSYQNEELVLAIEQLRLRRPDVPWLIPVRFDECAIPDRHLGGGRTLASIQSADLFGDHIAEGTARLVAAVRRILDRASNTQADDRTELAHIRKGMVSVSIVAPEAMDASFGSVRSVVYVEASEPVSDLTACYVTDHIHGGTTGLGHAPFHIATNQWRIRSEFLLRSVQHVIIGYSTVVHGRKVQRFQWDGHDHEYDWTAPGADGSHLSALLQIRRKTLSGQGPSRGPFLGTGPRRAGPGPGQFAALRAYDPQRIGGYSLLARLGASYVGVTYLGRSPSGEVVAIKIIGPEFADELYSHDRFARELAALQRVESKFSPRFIGTGNDAGARWVATQYIPAPSLGSLVRRCGPLSALGVQWLVAGCARALASIHEAGIIHRGLKPSDILVSADGPCVIGFGMASEVATVYFTTSNRTMGTVQYIAPEQLRGPQHVTFASDIFCFGATLVFAATGHPPFTGNTILSLLSEISAHPPEVGDLPAELSDIVTRCLDRDPAKRPTIDELISYADTRIAGRLETGTPPVHEGAIDLIESYSLGASLIGDE